ncbi:zinc-finger homeodomain protein 2-like [Phragmites australis]|uniref:zinc-finger homeodomain protein 2-like n=1 Tax=Phragmites australis TaxID=29695 RepID=UPI002D7A04C3|nr:zinc-finger homeodomain protein 2-like [Phragmites australis]
MDFDEHDDGDGDEEMPPIPVSLSYEPQLQPGLGLGGGGTPKPGDSGGGVFRTPGGCGVRGDAGGRTRYRECLKNHAVGIGGHAVDGCGEFMAAGEEGSIDALRCAACGCHRNFHRKESDWPTGAASAEPAALSPAAITAYGAAAHHQFSPYYRTPAGYLYHQHKQLAAAAAAAGHMQRPLALPSTSHSVRDEGDDMSGMIGPMVVAPMVGMSLGSGGPSGSSSGKKRFRTKFTQEQKDRMLAFAERLGWRIQKHDEAAVQQFCEEVCVKRHVLKVWMHNNKHTLGKKPLP